MSIRKASRSLSNAALMKAFAYDALVVAFLSFFACAVISALLVPFVLMLIFKFG